MKDNKTKTANESEEPLKSEATETKKEDASENPDQQKGPLEKPQASQPNIMFVPAVYVPPKDNLIMPDDEPEE